MKRTAPSLSQAATFDGILAHLRIGVKFLHFSTLYVWGYYIVRRNLYCGMFMSIHQFIICPKCKQKLSRDRITVFKAYIYYHRIV